jgi:RNA polymerase sigma-70 factor (ECF subfamily)
VLLLTLAVPVAATKSRAHTPTQTACRTPVERSSRRTSGTSHATLQRRDETDDQSGLSAETVTLAGNYLRCRAEGLVPSNETRLGWERFYEPGNASIRRFAETFRRRGVDVEECTQEVWGHLLTSLPNLQMDAARGRFSSWLYTIVRNKATDMLRRQRTRAAAGLGPTDIAQIAAADSNPLERLERQSRCESLRTAMARLRKVASESSYSVLILRHFAGWSVQDVADALGFSREQVWVREHRMKSKLRSLLCDVEAA